MNTHNVTEGQQAVSTEEAACTHEPQSAGRQICGFIKTGLAAGLALFATQTALAKPAILTVESIKAVSVSDDAITIDDSSREDEIYFTIDGVAVWPLEGYARTFKEGDTHRVDMSFEFDTATGVTMELWERDTTSANDSLSSTVYKDNQSGLGPLKLPYNWTSTFSDVGASWEPVTKKSLFSGRATYEVKINIVDNASNCVSFFTEPNGQGKLLNICGGPTYMNLGTSGAGVHSHHGAVQSFKCGAGVKYVQFINGNASPWGRHNEYCVAGQVVNTKPWVKAAATGVLFAK